MNRFHPSMLGRPFKITPHLCVVLLCHEVPTMMIHETGSRLVSLLRHEMCE